MSLDRAFARQQVASQSLMSVYVAQLSAVAIRPEIKTLLAGAGARTDAELARGRRIEAMLARRDSIAAVDSAVVRSARAARAARTAPRPLP
jgi:hypothetical protein